MKGEFDEWIDLAKEIKQRGWEYLKEDGK